MNHKYGRILKEKSTNRNTYIVEEASYLGVKKIGHGKPPSLSLGYIFDINNIHITPSVNYRFIGLGLGLYNSFNVITIYGDYPFIEEEDIGWYSEYLLHYSYSYGLEYAARINQWSYTSLNIEKKSLFLSKKLHTLLTTGIFIEPFNINNKRLLKWKLPDFFLGASYLVEKRIYEFRAGMSLDLSVGTTE